MRRTIEETEKIVNSLKYILLDSYRKPPYTRVVIQDEIGYKYDVILNNLIQNNIKPEIINKNNPFVLENISLWLKTNRPDFELCSESVYESNQKIKFYHSICNDYPLMSWGNMYRGVGCGICSNHQIGKENSLYHTNSFLAKEWHPDNEMSSHEVSISSGKRVFWICSKCGYGKNKEWVTSVANRTANWGCPACSGRVVSDKNRLSIIHPKLRRNGIRLKTEI